MKKHILIAFSVLIFYILLRFTLIKADKDLTAPKTFYFKYSNDAQKIFITGTFNNWNYSDDDYQMDDSDGDGIAKITLKLAPSVYEYKFYVEPRPDTVKRWFTDENAAVFENDGYGGKNSVVKVEKKGVVNFSFKAPDYAKEIYLTGDFDDWKFNKYPMVKKGSLWTIDCELPAGRYAYKFVVNPKEIAEKEHWFTDPSAKQTKPDEYGKTNAVIEVKTLKNFIFFCDLFFVSLLLIIIFSSVLSFFTKKIMQIKVKLTAKFVIVILLVSFVSSFLLIFTELRERKSAIETEARYLTNLFDAWLVSLDVSPNTKETEKKLEAVMENMVSSPETEDARFNTGIKAAAIYDKDGKILACALSKTIEERTKGESEILTALKKINPKGTNRFTMLKILDTATSKDILAIYPVKKGEAVDYYLAVDFDRFKYINLRKKFLVNKIFAIFVIIAIATIIAFVLSDSMLGPLKKLNEAMGSVRSGNYQQKIEIKTHDELEDLSMTFNFMTAEIKRFHDLQIDKIIEEKTKTKAIIFSIEDGIILTDYTGKILLYNKQAIEHLGLYSGDFENKNINNLLPYPEIIKAVEDVSKNPEQRIFVEIKVPIPKVANQFRFLKTESLIVKTEKNERFGVVTVYHDITLEKELDEMKSHFFSAIVHDLKTPVTSIVGYLDLMSREKLGVLSAEQKRVMSIVKASVQKLRDLINNILDVAKIESGKTLILEKKKFNLYMLVESLIQTFSPEANALNIEIKNEVLKDIPEMYADEKQIERVISNLVSNALKFTLSGGKICINANLVQSSEFRVQSEISTNHEPRITNHIRISISDTGSGIPQSELEKIFLRFHQVKGTEKRGTGLGLTICRHIVELHGGKISVESEIGKGSKFIIEIPG